MKWRQALAAIALAASSLAAGACSHYAQESMTSDPEPARDGRFVEIGPFAVRGLPDQRLTVWLPPGYDTAKRHYPVLYMHDGHNLFDPAKSNFNKVWAADKAVTALVRDGRIRPHIIVGIWPPGANRYRQYLPQFAAERATGELSASIAANLNSGPVVSARYLEWIADELKPQIDRDYRTLPGAADTAIAGSSMGGLMSCYAIVERPDIFGRAACISSHWPIALPDGVDETRQQAQAIWRDWFTARLGKPDGRRIWMDHGTATLDAYYAPYQESIDAAFRDAGWTETSDWNSRVYEGAEHEENAWAQRLPEVLAWLLADRE